MLRPLSCLCCSAAVLPAGLHWGWAATELPQPGMGQPPFVLTETCLCPHAQRPSAALSSPAVPEHRACLSKKDARNFSNAYFL